MRAGSRVAGDVALAFFGVLVLAGAVAAVRQGASPPPPSTVAVVADASTAAPAAPAASPSSTPTPTPSPSTTATPTTSPAAVGSLVVIAGPDLATLATSLASASGARVVTVAAAAPEVLAPGALEDVSATPRAVVLEVLAGSMTTTRTTKAITAVTAKWPEARVIVVGPFSSADRKSAAAARSAALAAKATFLDPVLLGWRTEDVSPVLTAADETAVTAQLATALA